MLGKLYVTATSTAEKLQSVHSLAAEAIELKIAPDATARNALTKLHAALSKAVGEAAPSSPRKSAAAVVVKEEAAESEEASVPDAEHAAEETKMEGLVEERGAVKDSVLEELLDKEEEL